MTTDKDPSNTPEVERREPFGSLAWWLDYRRAMAADCRLHDHADVPASADQPVACEPHRFATTLPQCCPHGALALCHEWGEQSAEDQA